MKLMKIKAGSYAAEIAGQRYTVDRQKDPGERARWLIRKNGTPFRGVDTLTQARWYLWDVEQAARRAGKKV